MVWSFEEDSLGCLCRQAAGQAFVAAGVEANAACCGDVVGRHDSGGGCCESLLDVCCGGRGGGSGGGLGGAVGGCGVGAGVEEGDDGEGVALPWEATLEAGEVGVAVLAG